MGMFNTIYVHCPGCGRRHEEQTKSGDCSLSCYSLDEAPTQDLLGVADHVLYCDCGRQLKIVVKTFAVVQVQG